MNQNLQVHTISPALPGGSETVDFQAITESEIELVIRDIERDGYAAIENYVSEDDMYTLRNFVHSAVARADNSYVVLKGPASVAGTALERMAVSPSLRRLCTRIYEVATSKPAPDQPYYQILRCLTGSVGQSHSMVFHYDTYVLTIILPIEIPTGKDNGELILLANARKIRSTYAMNLVDKLVLDNKVTQRVLRAAYRRYPKRFVKINMVPGTLYLFWGYRTVHTNAPCDPDKVRATAVMHYADPHSGSRMKAWLGR